MPFAKILFGLTSIWLLSFAIAECDATIVDELLKRSEAVAVATPLDLASWLLTPKGLSYTSIQVLSSALSERDPQAFRLRFNQALTSQLRYRAFTFGQFTRSAALRSDSTWRPGSPVATRRSGPPVATPRMRLRWTTMTRESVYRR